jgi:hypothetical protein
MSVVEDYAREAKAEIVAVLRERVRRMDECLISDSNINKIIKMRFGVTIQRAGDIRENIIPELLEAGVLAVWGHNNTSGRIYAVQL